jgi:hypothetical protein
LIPRCRNQSIAPRFDIEEMSYGQRKVQLNRHRRQQHLILPKRPGAAKLA